MYSFLSQARWPQASRKQLVVGALLIAGVLLTGAIYSPGLSGPFVFDDYSNILRNPKLAITDLDFSAVKKLLFSGRAGPSGRPISMLSFGIEGYLHAFDVTAMKRLNLAIHLINGLLVFTLIRRLLEIHAEVNRIQTKQTDSIAVVVAIVWMVHPVLLTSVLYVVQRMTSLSALFVFAGLLCFLRARQDQMRGVSHGILEFAGFAACGVLSVLCKENGALLPLYALIIELTILRFRVRCAFDRYLLRLFYVITVLIPLTAIAVFLVSHPDWMRFGEVGRGFTVEQRLLTQARVLFFYIRLLFLPAAGELALYYDDIQISRNIFDPATTLLSVLGLLSIVCFAVINRRRWPMLSFAVLWFLAAHAMESTFILLELVHPHRNYVAYVGPLIALFWLLFGFKHVRPAIVRGAVVVVITAFSATTLARVTQWADIFTLAKYEVYHRPQSARANYEMGRAYFLASRLNISPDEHLQNADKYFRRAGVLNPRSVGPIIGRIMVMCTQNKIVPSTLLKEIFDRQAKHPVVFTETGYYQAVLASYYSGECGIEPDQLVALLGSAITHTGGSTKARFLLFLGTFYLHLNDPLASSAVLQDAIALNPGEFATQVVLAGANLQLGRTDTVKAWIKEAREKDRYKVREPQLIRIENLLTTRRDEKQ